MLKRTISLRQLFWVPKTYVLVEKKEKWFSFTHSYLEALLPMHNSKHPSLIAKFLVFPTAWKKGRVLAGKRHFQNIVFLGRKSKTLNLYTRKTKQSIFYYNHNMLNICFYGIKGTMVYHMWQALFLMKNIMRRSLCFWPLSMCVRDLGSGTFEA